MYKLTIISGPNRGTSYGFQDGEVSIGRQMGNTVVLVSPSVSKRHCVLVVQNDEIILRDHGSSNGTFVNGILTRSKTIGPGDRIGVGEFILELVKPTPPSLHNAPAIYGLGNVIQFPDKTQKKDIGAEGNTTSLKSIERVPQDFKEKVALFIDKQIMPFFYALNFKYDLKTIGAWILTLLCLGSLLVSIQPLIEVNHQSLINELGLRAKFIAKQIVAKNAPFLATKTDISTDIGSLEKSEKDVRMAILVDLENRILAPTNRMNQYLVSGEEAKIAIQTRNRFLSGREEGVIIEATNHNVVAIEPVKIFNPRLNKNIVIAMAIVSIDSLQSLPSLGDVGLFYSKAIVLNGLLFIIAFLILYFSTLKPFQVLNDDIDKVLKGDMNQVTKEFKISELSSLWDNINSALQRVPRSTMTMSGVDNMSFQGTLSSADCVAPFEVIGGISKHGIVVCDSEKKILYFNQVFEEISGLHIEQVKGETLMSAGRDQAFLALCQDMFSKVVSGGPSIQEEFEFSGVLFGIYLIAMGAAGTAPKCYVFIIEKKEGA